MRFLKYLIAVSLFIYFLLLNLHRVDPKRKNKTPSVQLKRIAVITVIFLSVLNFMLLLSVNNTITLSPKLLLVFLGLLMAFIGNYMNNIKPNYFAGIRLPWTLGSDYNWKSICKRKSCCHKNRSEKKPFAFLRSKGTCRP